jgi:hypothetical protein
MEDPENIYDIHFVFIGYENTPFEKGIYHAMMRLDTKYPLSSPLLFMFTPSGRFEISKYPPDDKDRGISICDGYNFYQSHEEYQVYSMGETLRLLIATLLSENHFGRKLLISSDDEIRKYAKNSTKEILSDKFAQNILEHHSYNFKNPIDYFSLFVLYSDNFFQLTELFESNKTNNNSLSNNASFLSYLNDYLGLNTIIEQQFELEIYNKWRSQNKTQNNIQTAANDIVKSEKFNFESNTKKESDLAYKYFESRITLTRILPDDLKSLESYKMSISDEFKNEFAKRYYEKFRKDFELDFKSMINMARAFKIIKYLPLELQYIVACRILNIKSNYMKSHEHLLFENSLKYFIGNDIF